MRRGSHTFGVSVRDQRILRQALESVGGPWIFKLPIIRHMPMMTILGSKDSDATSDQRRLPAEATLTVLASERPQPF